ncbi:MAG: hypothetical protein ACHWZW_15655 [Spirulina sp.]
MDYRLGLPSLSLVASLGLLPVIPSAPVSQASLSQPIQPLANRVIIIHRPSPWPHPWPYPHPVPVPAEQRVRVEFDALGTDWGAVYLDGRLIYRPHNFNRQHTVHLRPGGYRLEVTGVVQSDLWASGYLDIGRDDSNIVVIRFSRTGGVSVSGSPYVWIPD